MTLMPQFFTKDLLHTWKDWVYCLVDIMIQEKVWSEEHQRKDIDIKDIVSHGGCPLGSL